MSNFDAEVDATGLACPLPILRAKKAVAGLASGQILKVTASDPGSIKDFAAFCQQTGNELMSSSEDDGIYIYFIKVADS